MNFRRITLLTLTLLAASGVYVLQPIAQQPPVDKERTRQELETMEGILRTTFDYAAKRVTQKDEANPARFHFRFHPGGAGSIRSFYLLGQGAVFVVPANELDESEFSVLVPEIADLDLMIPDPEEIQAVVEEATSKALGQEPDAQTAEKKEQSEKQREKLRAQREQQREKLQKVLEEQKAKLAEQREELRKRREDLAKRREELQRRVNEMKVYLKDTLANHGDSLSIVKPDESVTVVINGGSGFTPWSEENVPGTCTVISVKKSLVTDLKAGKVSREEFDRRVVDYSY